MGFVCGVFLLLTLPALAWTKVVNDFSECKTFFLDGTPPTVLSDQKRYRLICQNHENQYEFATLYDTSKLIPVYSAYTYKSCGKGKRPHVNWVTENDLGNEAQALDKDYKTIQDSQKVHGYNRGHLFPVCHAESQSAKDATFTLTNIVPQNVEFNNIGWGEMEDYVKNYMNKMCSPSVTYTVTGAVPSTKNLVNKKVNIPDYMWTASCCNKDGRWVSRAHYGKNAMGEVPVSVSLEKLEEQLTIDYNERFLVFGGKCYEDKPFISKYLDYSTNLFQHYVDRLCGNSVIKTKQG
uniref:Endonuclease domain-containing 1 protein-like n=1 Tax=Oncorhynchus mykiss TaxID=8022 RepID=A0A8C7P478_ONCMY